MCYQTQRYAMYESNQLVFETSQVQPAACSEPRRIITVVVVSSCAVCLQLVAA